MRGAEAVQIGMLETAGALSGLKSKGLAQVTHHLVPGGGLRAGALKLARGLDGSVFLALAEKPGRALGQEYHQQYGDGGKGPLSGDGDSVRLGTGDIHARPDDQSADNLPQDREDGRPSQHRPTQQRRKDLGHIRLGDAEDGSHSDALRKLANKVEAAATAVAGSLISEVADGNGSSLDDAKEAKDGTTADFFLRPAAEEGADHVTERAGDGPNGEPRGGNDEAGDGGLVGDTKDGSMDMIKSAMASRGGSKTDGC